jgi:hypothetical protein
MVYTLMRMRVTCIDSSASTPVKIYSVEVDLSSLEHRDYFERISSVKFIEINFINIMSPRR